jgi:hypothetical protein
MISSWIDYYRCPEEFARFGISGELCRTPGFFRFGPEITCYGRSAGAVAQGADGNLADTVPLVQFREEETQLPFDPDEILDNLRSERYVSHGEASSLGKNLIRNAYYAARPFLPVAVRKHFQRFHLRGWKDIKFPAWPVDKTIDTLCAELMALSVRANQGQRIPFIWFWPDGHKGCVLMTHDVEHEPGRAFCGELMDLDDRYGIRASFQVVPQERYTVSERFLATIRARGFEVNVHDFNHDGHLFDSHEQFLKRAGAINKYAAKMAAEGFRAGAMYRNPEWIHALQVSYDMSVPNSAHLDPQKGGCCTVLPYLVGGLVELPQTTTQDYSLFHMLGRYSIDLWKAEIDDILTSHGLAGFIVHPDYVIDRRARSVFEDLLRYLSKICKQRNLWQPLPREVARWWRERSRMQIVRSGDSWKIVGPGSERAYLAFAQLEDGRVTYRVDHAPCPASIA